MVETVAGWYLRDLSRIIFQGFLDGAGFRPSTVPTRLKVSSKSGENGVGGAVEGKGGFGRDHLEARLQGPSKLTKKQPLPHCTSERSEHVGGT